MISSYYSPNSDEKGKEEGVSGPLPREAATKLEKENDDLNLKYAVAVLKGKGGLVTGARIMEELDRLKAVDKGVPSGPHAL